MKNIQNEILRYKNLMGIKSSEQYVTEQTTIDPKKIQQYIPGYDPELIKQSKNSSLNPCPYGYELVPSGVVATLSKQINNPLNSTTSNKYLRLPDGRYCEKKGISQEFNVGSPEIKTFNFLGQEIPILVDTELFYVTTDKFKDYFPIDGEDKYGPYQNIEVESWDNADIRRYLPKDGWEDLKFLKDNKIPIAFRDRYDHTFGLVLRLVDPIKSVLDLDDPSNVNRGWQLSMPGISMIIENESNVGYYRMDGAGNYIAYNIIAPTTTNDPGGRYMDLDERSDFDLFMDDWGSVVAQIIVAAVTYYFTRRAVIINIPAAFAENTAYIQTRLMIGAIIAEAIQNVPISIYYFNRPGFEDAGWLSLAFLALPLLQRYTFLSKILPDFSEVTCYEISKELMEKGLKSGSKAEAMTFYRNLPNMRAKALFKQVMENFDQLDEYLKKEIDDLVSKDIRWKNLSNKKLFAQSLKEFEALMKSSKSTSLIVNIVKDFGFTLFFMKIVEKMILGSKSKENLEKAKEKVDEKGKELIDGIQNNTLTKEQKEKLKENLTKVEEEINSLPGWMKRQQELASENPDEYKDYLFDWSDPQIIADAVSMGILSDKTKKEWIDACVESFFKMGMDKLDKMGRSDFKLLAEFIYNNYVCGSLGKEKCDRAKKLLEEIRKKRKSKETPSEQIVSDFSKYPCVVNHPDAVRIDTSTGTVYQINDFYYYNDGYKTEVKPENRQYYQYTCTDKEFIDYESKLPMTCNWKQASKLQYDNMKNKQSDKYDFTTVGTGENIKYYFCEKQKPTNVDSVLPDYGQQVNLNK